MIYDIFSPANNLQNIVLKYVVINSFEGIENLIFLPNGGNFIVFNRGFKGHVKSKFTEHLNIEIESKCLNRRLKDILTSNFKGHLKIYNLKQKSESQFECTLNI